MHNRVLVKDVCEALRALAVAIGEVHDAFGVVEEGAIQARLVTLRAWTEEIREVMGGLDPQMPVPCDIVIGPDPIRIGGRCEAPWLGERFA